MQPRLFRTLIFIAGIMFILLWLVLHFFNRFAADDYQLLYERFHYGALNATLHQYFSWCGRWLPLGFMFTMLSLGKWGGFLFVYGIFTILIFLLATYRFARVATNRYLPQRIPGSVVLTFSIFFILTFFSLTPQKNEVWFWYNSTSMYQWNIIMLIFGMSFLIGEEKGPFELFFIALSFMYVGAASEPFAIALIGVMMGFTAWHKIKNDTFSLKNLFAIGALVFAFILSIIAEGNSIRANYLPPASGRVAMINTIKTFYNIIHYHGINMAGLSALFFMCWLGFGMYLSNTYRPVTRIAPRFLIVKTFLFISVSLVVVFVSTYTLGGVSPQRVLGAVFFSYAIFIAVGGTYFGVALGPKKIAWTLATVSAGLILVYNGYLLFRHTAIESKYANAVDVRLELLRQYKEEGNERTIYLAPLPDPGFLHSAEIKADTGAVLNQQLKAGLQLDFEVAVKK